MPRRDDDIHQTPGLDQCPPNGDGEQCPQAPALRQIRADTREILMIMRGDGSDDRPGMLIEMDRVKQANMERDKRISRIENAILGLLVFIALAVVAAILGLVLVNQKVNKVSALERATHSDTFAGAGRY